MMDNLEQNPQPLVEAENLSEVFIKTDPATEDDQELKHHLLYLDAERRVVPLTYKGIELRLPEHSYFRHIHPALLSFRSRKNVTSVVLLQRRVHKGTEPLRTIDEVLTALGHDRKPMDNVLTVFKDGQRILGLIDPEDSAIAISHYQLQSWYPILTAMWCGLASVVDEQRRRTVSYLWDYNDWTPAFEEAGWFAAPETAPVSDVVEVIDALHHWQNYKKSVATVVTSQLAEGPVCPTETVALPALLSGQVQNQYVQIVGIAAIDAEGGLGKDGDLLFKIPGDLKRFRNLTLGHPVIMGVNTFRSLPVPLKGRQMIVVSTDIKRTRMEVSQRGWDAMVLGLDEAITTAKLLAALAGVYRAYVIGGAQLLRACLAAQYIDAFELTQLDEVIPGADVVFPIKDLLKCKDRSDLWKKTWVKTRTSERMYSGGLTYRFSTFNLQ